MIIDLHTIPHDKQRYKTLGDWYYGGGGLLLIRASQVGDQDYEFLLLLHELVEAWLCRKRGISEKDVDSFDLAYAGEGEPGDDPKAPYYKEHLFATQIEKMMAAELGVDWNEYELELEKFFRNTQI
jgi:hypothetical protein